MIRFLAVAPEPGQVARHRRAEPDAPLLDEHHDGRRRRDHLGQRRGRRSCRPSSARAPEPRLGARTPCGRPCGPRATPARPPRAGRPGTAAPTAPSMRASRVRSMPSAAAGCARTVCPAAAAASARIAASPARSGPLERRWEKPLWGPRIGMPGAKRKDRLAADAPGLYCAPEHDLPRPANVTMQLRLPAVLAVSLSAWLAPAVALAQSGLVQGRVRGPDGTPIQDARVTGENLRSGRTVDDRTNSAGRFAFIGLTRGPWLFTIEKFGYETATGISNIFRSGRTRMTFVMEVDPLRPPVPETGVLAGIAAGDLQESLDAAHARFDRRDFDGAIGLRDAPRAGPRLTSLHLQIGHARRSATTSGRWPPTAPCPPIRRPPPRPRWPRARDRRRRRPLISACGPRRDNVGRGSCAGGPARMPASGKIPDRARLPSHRTLVDEELRRRCRQWHSRRRAS